jgi:hypothetical protein
MPTSPCALPSGPFPGLQLRRLVVPVLAAVTLAPLAGCGGAFLQRLRGDGGAGGEETGPSEQWRQVEPFFEDLTAVDRLREGLAEVARRRQRHADHHQRPRWEQVRSEALLSMVVVADVMSDVDPLLSDALFDLVASEAAVADGSALELQRVLSAIVGGLRQGGWDEADVIFARTLLEAALSQQEDERWYGTAIRTSRVAPEARLMALSRAMRRFAQWARRGTGSGGEAMILDCGFLCGMIDAPPTVEARASLAGYRCPDADGEPRWDEALGDWCHPAPGWDPWEMLRRCGPEHALLPAQPGSPLLLSEANWLDALLLTGLAALHQDVQGDRAAGARVTLGAAAFLRSVDQRLGRAAIPQTLTANALSMEPRLDLPVARDALSHAEATLLAEEPALRLLQIRSDGVFLALRPHLALQRAHADDAPRLVYAEDAGGYHWPGSPAARMERPGAIHPDEVAEDGTMPGLVQALHAMERFVLAESWVALEARDPGTEVVSLFVDGDTYVSSVESVALAVEQAGYAGLQIPVLHGPTGLLLPLPVRFGPVDGGEGPLLVVREDGYRLERDTGPPRLLSRADARVLSTLALDLATDGGGGESPILRIQVDDGTTDWGILAHLIHALAWEREGEGVAEDDRAWLRRAVRFEEGEPVLRFRDGVRVSTPR